MSEMSSSTLAIGIAFTVVSWAAIFWLFASRTGNTILRVTLSLFAIAALIGCLYLHWEPYVALVCLPAGFVAGVLFAEWHYGIRGVIGLRSDQQHQRQQPEYRGHFQQEPRPMLDYERAELTYQSDPAAKPRA
jgi:hypothetical protein